CFHCLDARCFAHSSHHPFFRSRCCSRCLLLFFFFNAPATTEIYTLSLHDALPIFTVGSRTFLAARGYDALLCPPPGEQRVVPARSEEHTSELQSLTNLVCRLLLEKKKRNTTRDKSERCTRP